MFTRSWFISVIRHIGAGLRYGWLRLLNIGVEANTFVMAFCTSVSALTPVNKKT